jgi:hypothetical protein
MSATELFNLIASARMKDEASSTLFSDRSIVLITFVCLIASAIACIPSSVTGYNGPKILYL